MSQGTVIEAAVIRQVANVLNLELGELSLSDNFLTLGGDSLSAIVVVDRLCEDLNCEIPFEALFEVQSLAGLCRRIAEAKGSNDGSRP